MGPGCLSLVCYVSYALISIFLSSFPIVFFLVINKVFIIKTTCNKITVFQVSLQLPFFQQTLAFLPTPARLIKMHVLHSAFSGVFDLAQAL